MGEGVFFLDRGVTGKFGFGIKRENVAYGVGLAIGRWVFKKIFLISKIY